MARTNERLKEMEIARMEIARKAWEKFREALVFYQKEADKIRVPVEYLVPYLIQEGTIDPRFLPEDESKGGRD